MYDEWNWTPHQQPAAPKPAPASGTRRRSWRKTAALTGLAGAVTIAGAGIAHAATDDPTPTPGATGSGSTGSGSTGSGGGSATESPQSTDPGAMGGQVGGHGMRMHGRGMPGLFGPGIHGQSVVKDANGNYVTVSQQRGEVTAVSGTAITVKSEDGFSQTYTVTADTLVDAARDGISTVKKGHTVRVIATGKDASLKAIAVSDQTLHADAMKEWRPQRGENPRGSQTPGGSGSGSGSGSGGSSSGATPNSGPSATPSSFLLTPA